MFLFTSWLLADIEGLEISIQANKKVYLLEEPIECRFIFKNNNSKDIEVRDIGVSPVPVPLKLSILDKKGRNVECIFLERSIIKPLDTQKWYVKLLPGDSLMKYSLINDPFGVISCSDLRGRSGLYRITVQYCDDWKSELNYSDTTTIEITKPTTRTDVYVLGLYRKANSMRDRKERMDLYLHIANNAPNSAYAPYSLYQYTWLSMFDAGVADKISPFVAVERAKKHINRYPDFGQNATLGKIFFLELQRCYEKSLGNEAYKAYLNELQEQHPNTILYESIELTKEFMKKYLYFQLK